MTYRNIFRIRNLLKKILPIVFSSNSKVFQRLSDYANFRHFIETSSNFDKRFEIHWSDRLFYRDGGADKHFDTHYIYHTAWAARILKSNPIPMHYDFSSSLYFSGIVSAYQPVTFLDIRPASLNISNYNSGVYDLMDGNKIQNGELESISCMHVIEHIGLGRYGDTINPEGDILAAKELQRIAANKAKLLIVVPVGRQIIRFDAHRIYNYEHVVKMFSDCKLVSCALIPDDALHKGIIYNPQPNQFNNQKYGCGCFEFEKI
jgi:hypothetical protein